MPDVPEKVPYIKRLEIQRDALVRALKSVDAFNEAMARADTCAYKYDAFKHAGILKKKVQKEMDEAKSILGGAYA